MSNDYRKDFRDAEHEYYWSMPKIAFAIVFGCMVLGAAGWAVNILSQPGRIVSKTLDADNVLQNYEWFHDANGNFLSKTAQVRQFKVFAADPTNDAGERARSRIDLAAIQQSCRDLARRYNANAEKMNRGIFRSHSLPDQLNAGECE